MKKVKVVFRGNKSPSGKLPNIEYLIGEKKLDNLKKDGKFQIDVIDETPAPKPKKKKTAKKGDNK